MMAAKKTAPQYAPLKPTTAWAVVANQTGEIVEENCGNAT